jgi:hypothetical protein
VIDDSILKSNRPKEVVSSLFPNKDILTKEIESWRNFVDSLPS